MTNSDPLSDSFIICAHNYNWNMNICPKVVLGFNWYLNNHNLALTLKVVHSGSNGNVFVTVQA